MNKIALLLLILAMLAVPVLAQVPDIGPAGCRIAYDQYGNLVPCGWVPDNLIWVIGFVAFILFLVFFAFPKSKKPPVQPQPQHVPKAPTVKKRGHVVKPRKVGGRGSYLWEKPEKKGWGVVSFVLGLMSILAAPFFLGFSVERWPRRHRNRNDVDIRSAKRLSTRVLHVAFDPRRWPMLPVDSDDELVLLRPYV